MQYVVLLLALFPQDTKEPIPRSARITLDERDITAWEVIEKIREQTGYSILGERPLRHERLNRVSLDKATFWEAISHLVDAVPILSLHHLGNETFQLASVKRPQILKATGPLMLALNPHPKQRLDAFLHLEPSPDEAVGIELEVLEARDGKGAPIAKWMGQKQYQELKYYGRVGLPSPRFTFNHSPPTLSVFRLKATLYYPVRWAQASVKPSIKEQPLDLEGLRVKCQITFSERRLPTISLTAAKVLEHADDQHLMSLLRTMQVRAFDASGAELPSSQGGRIISGTVKGYECWDIIEDITKKRSIGLRDIASIELKLVAEYVSRSYSFDLRDIRRVEE